jgi:hypothetical protein
MAFKWLPVFHLIWHSADCSTVGVLYTLTQDVDELSWLKSNPVTKPGVK